MVIFTRGTNARIAFYIRIYFFFFPYIYLYMYNMRCSPRGEEERATRRASSPRLSKEFANREEDMRW